MRSRIASGAFRLWSAHQLTRPTIARTTYYLRARAAIDVTVTIVAAENFDEPALASLFLAGSTSGVHISWGKAKLPIDHQRFAIGFGGRIERDLARCSGGANADSAGRALFMGRTLHGLKAMDVSAVIDWLTGLDTSFAADPDRIFL